MICQDVLVYLNIYSSKLLIGSINSVFFCFWLVTILYILFTVLNFSRFCRRCFDLSAFRLFLSNFFLSYPITTITTTTTTSVITIQINYYLIYPGRVLGGGVTFTQSDGLITCQLLLLFCGGATADDRCSIIIIART